MTDTVKTIKITPREADRVFKGLTLLDSYEETRKDGEGVKVVRAFYSFGAGLRLLIARHMNALEKIIKGYQDERNKLLKRVSGDKGVIEPKTQPDMAAEFSKLDADMQDEVKEYTLPLIELSELKVEEHPAITSSTLALCLPVLAA